MQQPSKNSLLVLGIAVAFSSLWMTWMTFEEVPVQSPVLDLQADLMVISGSRTYSGRMTGSNGSLLYLPIRIVLLVISLAHVTQLMDATTFFNIPKMVKYATLIVAIFFPVYAIVSPVFYPGITPNWGPYVALIASAIATATQLLPTTPVATSAEITGEH